MQRKIKVIINSFGLMDRSDSKDTEKKKINERILAQYMNPSLQEKKEQYA